MGMNYYLKTGKTVKKRCDLGHMHEVPEQIHIGKSSYGRYFCLHKVDVRRWKLHSLDSWKRFVTKCSSPEIVDEDGETVAIEEMWKIVTREGWEPSDQAKKLFKQCLLGHTVVDKYLLYQDVWGERGFIRTKGLEVGKDGLYELLEGEFH